LVDNEFWNRTQQGILLNAYFSGVVSTPQSFRDHSFVVLSPTNEIDTAVQEVVRCFLNKVGCTFEGRDFEGCRKIDFIPEGHKKENFAGTAEDLRIILDKVRVWMRKNNLVKEKKFI
jgi:hypothetical protein